MSRRWKRIDVDPESPLCYFIAWHPLWRGLDPPLDNPIAHVVTLGHPSGGHTELPFSVAALIIAFAGEFDETLTPPHYYLESYRILQCLCHVAPYVARVLAQINEAHDGYCVLLPHGWRREARMRTPSPHVISTSPSPEVIAIESSPEL